jgi:uncharacterized protein
MKCTLSVLVTGEDIARIARHLGMAPDEFIATYLERDEQEGGYLTKTTPCPFLGQDNKCTIYAVRPENCQGYPFTDEDFLTRTITHVNNAVVCPAVFYIVEQMKKRMWR